MIKISDFFEPLNLSSDPSRIDYQSVAPYIEALKALSLTTYQSIYVIDYYQQSFLYVSNNPLLLCGHSAEQVKKMGYDFYFRHVPKEDLALLLEINQAGFTFYDNLPIKSRLSHTISYDFHLIQHDKRRVLVSHKLCPLVLDKSANIWLAACMVSVSPNSCSGNVLIQETNTNALFQYSFKTKTWQSQSNIVLSSDEKEILMLSSQGKTTKDIAQCTYKSIATIKFHKKSIFKKMQVKNIAGAISFAVNYRLI